MKRLKVFFDRRSRKREINRPIPKTYSWYMTSEEKHMWVRGGWRVTYWVCPLCGTRRRESGPRVKVNVDFLYTGWFVYPRNCNCDLDF